MSDITALFRLKNRSKHPDSSVSFLRAIDFSIDEFHEVDKTLVLQVLNVTGGSGGPYYVDFSEVHGYSRAVILTKGGAVDRVDNVGYSEVGITHSVVEHDGMASMSFRMSVPDLSHIDLGVGVIGVLPDSFVTIRDSEGAIYPFTVLGVPLIDVTPVSQKLAEQTFAIVGDPAVLMPVAAPAPPGGLGVS